MTIFKILFAVILFTIPVLCAAQQNEWKQASAAGYTYKYVSNDPIGARFYTLKNGLTVILSPNKKEPRIAVRIAVRAGSNNDPKDHTGLAHYLEHLLFKGTDKYGSLDWQKEKPLLDSIENLYEQYNSTSDTATRRSLYKKIDEVSGRAAKFAISGEYTSMMSALGSQATNAHTSVDETIYEEDIPSNAIDQFLTIQAERFRNPILRIFHTELEAVYEEKNRSLDNDGSKIQEATFSTIFPTSNYGLQSTIGSIEHLKNPSIKAIRSFYDTYYVPNNMAVIMSGDFDPDQVIRKIDLQFAYMVPQKVNEYVSPVQKPIAGPVVKDIYGPNAESVRILYRGFPAGTREALLSKLVLAMLYNTKAGLVDLNINKQQKMLAAGADLWTFKAGGIFILGGTPKQDQTLEQAKDMLLEQINHLRKAQFDETLIKAVAANYKLKDMQGLENNAVRVDNLADEYITSKTVNWNKNVGEREEMTRVSKAALMLCINKLFTDNNFVILYKRKGVDKNLVKVEKPAITPVETNSSKRSAFVTSIIDAHLPAIPPVWIDYTKELQHGKAGNAEILYVQNKQNSLFKLTYRFNMGKWNNKLLPIAAQYLQYAGTEKFTAEEISKQFFYLACNYNVQIQDEQAIISISGLQENFEKSVALLEDLLKNCKPDQTALEGSINLLIKSRANYKLNKNAIAYGMQMFAMYGPQNPFNYVYTDEELKNIKVADVISLLHSLTGYQHQIGYFGPSPLPQLSAQLQRLHPTPAVWATVTSAITFDRTKQVSNKVLFCNYDAVQSEIYWVKNLDQYDPKSEALVNLFNGYFGAGMGSVVFSTIRESKALAYSTYAYVATPSKKQDSYSIVAYVGSQADKMNDAVTAMNELLNQLPKTAEKFENAKTSLVKTAETDRVTDDAIITSYLNDQRKGVDYDIRQYNYGQYASLRLDDLVKYHQQAIANQPYTYCIVASENKIQVDDLKKYGELTKLSLSEIFGY